LGRQDDLCDSTILCDENHKEFTVVVYDLEELNEKLFQLKMDNETDRNNLRFFDNQILIRSEEISRLQNKLDYLGQ